MIIDATGMQYRSDIRIPPILGLINFLIQPVYSHPIWEGFLIQEFHFDSTNRSGPCFCVLYRSETSFMDTTMPQSSPKHYQLKYDISLDLNSSAMQPDIRIIMFHFPGWFLIQSMHFRPILKRFLIPKLHFDSSIRSELCFCALCRSEASFVNGTVLPTAT